MTKEEEEAKRIADEEEAKRKAAESDEESSEDTEELSVEDLKKQLADSKKRIGELNHESAERRKKLEAFEEAEAKRKQAEMTEVEKANAKAQAAEEEKSRLAKENQTLKLQRDFENKVRDAKLEFRNSLAAKDAFNALVELLEGETEITDDHFKQLVKERDYLFGKPEANTQNNDAKNKGKGNTNILTEEQIAKKKKSISPL